MYSMDIHSGLVLGVAAAALVLSALALWRAYVPPQQRTVAALQADVADLAFAVEEFGKRLTSRARRENMDTARQAAEERKARRDTIESEAAALIEATRAVAPQPQQQPPSKAQLRAAMLAKGGSPTTSH